MNKPVRRKVQINKLERKLEKLGIRIIKINKEKQFISEYIEVLKREIESAPKPYVKEK